jgi:phosphoglycerate dehydrogenase-like enzyme
MMIALSRKFSFHYKAQQEGVWRQVWPETYDIVNSNVLVLGLGDIGTEVCERLSGFACNITGFRRDTSLLHEYTNEVRPLSRLRESLPDADYIIICLPGTAETANLIGREEFALMKKSAIIINIGRGSIIDTDALIDALNSKKIAGAGLDVTNPEPLPEGHPLWTAENVLITPHVSAASPTNVQRRLAIFTNLLKRYLSGQPMFNTVNFSAGY